MTVRKWRRRFAEEGLGGWLIMTGRAVRWLSWC